MKSDDYAGKDYFQYYVDCWQYGAADRVGSYDHSFRMEQLKELGDKLSGNSRVLGFVQSLELSKEDSGAKGRRWHIQGVVVHEYKSRQCCVEFIHKFAISKKLDGAAKDFGCLKGRMEKPLEDSIKYVLKDQGDSYVYHGFCGDYVSGLRGQWIPKGQFKGTLTTKQEDGGKKKTEPYCMSLGRDAVEYFTHNEPSRYSVLEYVLKRVIADKARLPYHMVVETSRAICVKLGLMDKHEIIEKLLGML